MRLPYILLFVLAITVVDGGFNCTPGLSLKPPKLYHADPTNKCKFFQCNLGGVAFAMNCPDGTKWSDKALSCVMLGNGEKCSACTDGKFGQNCTKDCHCKDKVACDKTTGRCPSQCFPGWRGDDCQTECTDGKFGQNCAKDCHCEDACDKVTGICPSKCLKGWQGDDCQTEFKLPKFKLPKCPKGFTRIDGVCYGVFKERKSWNDAKRSCIAKGGFLAEPKSLQENKNIVDVVKANDGGNTWIGATDRDSEGRWVWDHSQTSVSFTAWASGEPNNYWSEDCAHLRLSKYYRWNDANCHAFMFSFVCQTDDHIQSPASDASNLQPSACLVYACFGLCLMISLMK